MCKYGFIFLLLLAACGSTTPPLTVTKIISVYPDMPDVPALPPLTLQPFKYDYPRDNTGIVLKNSNIFLGFDIPNWNAFLLDWEKLKTREGLYQSRIDQINKERQMWKQWNQENPPLPNS